VKEPQKTREKKKKKEKRGKWRKRKRGKKGGKKGKKGKRASKPEGQLLQLIAGASTTSKSSIEWTIALSLYPTCVAPSLKNDHFERKEVCYFQIKRKRQPKNEKKNIYP